jgi:plastocyanin
LRYRDLPIAEEERFVLKISPLVLLLALAAVLVPGSARPAAKATALTATVGPAFSISLRDANGRSVTQLDPGDYTITVTDNSDMHNFHLFGPGSVDQATPVETTGTVTWNVSLVDGVYTYRCDAHPTQMRGTFRVGAAPPPIPKLTGKVGPARSISLKRGGATVKRLKAGIYRVVVTDATKKDNFHLVGPGVNKKTAVRGKGKFSWKLTFRPGVYRYRSDAHATLRRKFTALKPPTP